MHAECKICWNSKGVFYGFYMGVRAETSRKWVYDNIIISGDPLETDIPHWRPIRHAWSITCVSDGSPIRHVGIRLGMLVHDQVSWSHMRHVGLQWGMSVFDEACRSLMRYVGLRSDISVFDESPIIIIFSWTPRTWFPFLFYLQLTVQTLHKINFRNVLGVLGVLFTRKKNNG